MTITRLKPGAAFAATVLLLGGCFAARRQRCVPDEQAAGCMQLSFCTSREWRAGPATGRADATALIVMVADTMGTPQAPRPVSDALVQVAPIPPGKAGLPTLSGLPGEGTPTGRPIVAESETDALGAAVVTDLGAGTYAIRTRRVGYLTGMAAAEVRRGFRDTVWVYLRSAATC